MKRWIHAVAVVLMAARAQAQGAADFDTVPVGGPGTISDLSVVSTDSNQVLLHWTAPPSGGETDFLYYEVHYSATGPVNSTNWAAAPIGLPLPLPPDYPGADDGWNVGGLNPANSDISLFFAVRARNDMNVWSTVSNSVRADLHGDHVAPAEIQSLRLSRVAEDVARVTWLSSGDDGLDGCAARHEVRYSVRPITDANFASATPVPLVFMTHPMARQEMSTGVEGLPAVPLYFGVRAVDERNQAGPVVVGMLAELPPDAGMVTSTSPADDNSSLCSVAGKGGVAWMILAAGILAAALLRNA